MYGASIYWTWFHGNTTVIKAKLESRYLKGLSIDYRVLHGWRTTVVWVYCMHLHSILMLINISSLNGYWQLQASLRSIFNGITLQPHQILKILGENLLFFMWTIYFEWISYKKIFLLAVYCFFYFCITFSLLFSEFDIIYRESTCFLPSLLTRKNACVTCSKCSCPSWKEAALSPSFILWSSIFSSFSAMLISDNCSKFARSVCSSVASVAPSCCSCDCARDRTLPCWEPGSCSAEMSFASAIIPALTTCCSGSLQQVRYVIDSNRPQDVTEITKKIPSMNCIEDT